MAILISHQLTIGLKSELGGSFTVRWKQCAGATLGVLVRPLADLQRLPPGFPSPERASPNGSKNGGRVALRRTAQKRVRRGHRAQRGGGSVGHNRHGVGGCGRTL